MGVWAPVSSVTPGCAFHLPHRNSPCPRSHSPEKGKAASSKCLSVITAEPVQYGDGVVYLPAICTGSSGRGAAASSGKPRLSCTSAGRGGSSAEPRAAPERSNLSYLTTSSRAGIHLTPTSERFPAREGVPGSGTRLVHPHGAFPRAFSLELTDNCRVPSSAILGSLDLTSRPLPSGGSPKKALCQA